MQKFDKISSNEDSKYRAAGSAAGQTVLPARAAASEPHHHPAYHGVPLLTSARARLAPLLCTLARAAPLCGVVAPLLVPLAEGSALRLGSLGRTELLVGLAPLVSARALEWRLTSHRPGTCWMRGHGGRALLRGDGWHAWRVAWVAAHVGCVRAGRIHLQYQFRLGEVCREAFKAGPGEP